MGERFGSLGLGSAVRDNRVGMDVAADAVGIPADDDSRGVSENSPGEWQDSVNGKILARILVALRRAGFAAKSVSVRVVAGFVILALTALLYLGPYSIDAASCLDEMARGLFTSDRINWQCFKDVRDDLRKDAIAATVILAIAAAVLASAWSSGSDADAVE